MTLDEIVEDMNAKLDLDCWSPECDCSGTEKVEAWLRTILTEKDKEREILKDLISEVLYSHIEMARDSLKNAVADQVAPYRHQLGRLLQAKTEIIDILSDKLN